LAQANQFQALAQVFRHGHDRHPQVMRVVAGLVNRRLDKRPLKSYDKSYEQAAD